MTDNIHEIYQKVKKYFPRLLHPNGNKVELKPWKAKGFALLDESGTCLVIRQWPA